MYIQFHRELLLQFRMGIQVSNYQILQLIQRLHQCLGFRSLRIFNGTSQCSMEKFVHQQFRSQARQLELRTEYIHG